MFHMSEVTLYTLKSGEVQRNPEAITVRTGTQMGPLQGKRAPMVGHICIVILARE